MEVERGMRKVGMTGGRQVVVWEALEKGRDGEMLIPGMGLRCLGWPFKHAHRSAAFVI